MLKHYVQFLYPGFFSETSDKVIDHRNPDFVEMEPGTFGFRFFDREEQEFNGKKLTGNKENYSNWYYAPGKIRTKEEVMAEEPGSILADNMRFNDIERVVMTKFGQAIQLYEGDVVLTDSPKRNPNERRLDPEL